MQLYLHQSGSVAPAAVASFSGCPDKSSRGICTEAARCLHGRMGFALLYMKSLSVHVRAMKRIDSWTKKLLPSTCQVQSRGAWDERWASPSPCTLPLQSLGTLDQHIESESVQSPTMTSRSSGSKNKLFFLWVCSSPIMKCCAKDNRVWQADANLPSVGVGYSNVASAGARKTLKIILLPEISV